MVTQYPYSLELLTVAELQSTDVNDRDSKGDWVLTESQTSPTSYNHISNCRNGGNGGNNSELRYVVDGTQYVADCVIYLPKTCPVISLGAKVRVTEVGGTVRIEGIVKKFNKGQLHTRIWV